MAEPLRLLAIFAHPDDESLGLGSVVARYAAEGVAVDLLSATRGEYGWPSAEPNPGPAALGALREQELRAAGRVLGLRTLDFLDYIDGALDQAAPAEIVGRIAGHVRRLRPQVVVTFGPEGVYGHPDHIAISQFSLAALLAAADANYPAPGAPHRVAKCYYLLEEQRVLDLYQHVFGDLCMNVDGEERRPVGVPGWQITTRVHTGEHWRTAWAAVRCHATQIVGMPALLALDDEQLQGLWEQRTFYRVFSSVNGGRAVEDDLFAGLR